MLVASAPSKEFQSTLPRRERQTSANFPDPLDTISIHAPAKGATLVLVASAPSKEFQSTLPRRERQEWQGKVYSIDGFQSTLPRRERLCETDKRSIGLKFQSTLPRRERQQKRSRILTIQKFQSTLPRRERLSSADIETVHKHFNPRSREGSDRSEVKILTCQKISIHAPAKGATSMDDRLIRIETISIHAPAKGATNCLHDTLYHYCIFQSTLPRRERRRVSADKGVFTDISIHAPAKGATN